MARRVLIVDGGILEPPYTHILEDLRFSGLVRVAKFLQPTKYRIIAYIVLVTVITGCAFDVYMTAA